MNDQEAAAYTRGHAVGERELRAAEKRWQADRAMLIAQRNARTEEAERALEEIARLRRREPYEYFLAAYSVALTILILMGVLV